MAQATLNGQLTDDGGETCQVWFQWGGTSAYGMTTAPQGGMVNGSLFSQTILNLGEGSLYHFRAVAQNSQGIVYGRDVVFVTLPPEHMMVLVQDELLFFMEVSR